MEAHLNPDLNLQRNESVQIERLINTVSKDELAAFMLTKYNWISWLSKLQIDDTTQCLHHRWDVITQIIKGGIPLSVFWILWSQVFCFQFFYTSFTLLNRPHFSLMYLTNTDEYKDVNCLLATACNMGIFH